MNKRMILLAVVMLALASLACSINITLPSFNVKTGPMVTDPIYVSSPENKGISSDVTINFGAGNLTLNPGAKGALVDGTATYNVPDFKPKVNIQNDNVSIDQGELDLKGIPSFTKDITNDWNLNFGNYPMSLVINAGAYNGEYDLGGLSLERLEIGDGAARVNVNFSAPNQVKMRSLEYTTGASEVTLIGLANANTSDITFRSGAGKYTLDFSGELQGDIDVNIESGVSSVTVAVPEGVNAKVITTDSFLTVSTDGTWHQFGDTYKVNGNGYTITLHVKMGAGNLKLETINP